MLEQWYQLCSSADVPTFRSGDNSSTIDYIYASPDLHRHFHSTTTDYLNTNWTDHAVLVVNFKFTNHFQGHGLWRANPALAKNQYFVKELYRQLDSYHSQLQPSDIYRTSLTSTHLG